ncbi:methyltransferase [Arthrobacter sp. UKPF54-2]|uniref:class I SAM-dependent methyltransferase n=1 Tax=Arthrobacter sp. UKPF54-2 TaxID=2600159 RepID=UPI0011B1A602|nr:class I SAM-dependent methyltransferase [Arthrobacter sp. UKPF54-2]QDY90913.1 methyltransferase [Arthrobacter sp. UKPF54-2]
MQSTLEQLFPRLRRFPDVEAANLQAWDATDRLLLDTAAELRASGVIAPGTRTAVVGDRYGALTLGLLALGRDNGTPGMQAGTVRVHEDLVTGERALRHNAEAVGITKGFDQLPLDAALDGAGLVLLQLPRSLAELDEIADAVARHAAPGVVLLAGGRVKHMSLGMNAVLERYFGEVQPQLARQKSRILLARAPKAVAAAPPFPVTERNAELDLTVCARGAVFSGTGLDIGTRFLLEFLPEMPAVRHAVDLGCGTGILAAMYARSHPDARVIATDRSAAAVESARETARANGLDAQIDVLQDDAMSTLPDAGAGLVLLNPPFHLGAAVHAGAGLKLIEAAARVLAPGGELWTVFNSHLQYRPALERLVGPTREVGRNAKFTVTASVRTARP